MKKQLLFVVSLITIFMASCSQNDDILNEVIDNDVLAKIEMSYEQRLKGYTPEEVAASKDESTPSTEPETVADAELMNLIQESVESSYSKTRVETRISGPLPYMGVFKHNTCGNFPELRIFMDCEDGGWTNVDEQAVNQNLLGTWIDGNNNIWMTFCIVTADRNDMVPLNTGALYFVGGNASLIQDNAKRLVTPKNNLSSLTFVERLHDNEDSNNMNEALYNGSKLSGSFNELGNKYPDYTPRPTYVGERNTQLTWMFPNFDPIKPFKPGFSYGVLSYRLPVSQCIKINIDDENKKNTNTVYEVSWSGTGYRRTQHTDPYKNTYKGMTATENTIYYVEVIK